VKVDRPTEPRFADKAGNLMTLLGHHQ